jgi:DNA-binding response OmpR family regulator
LNETVLIIDDDKSVLRTFSKILQKAGYVIDTAETGKDAMEKVSKRSFDVVLVDFRLPDMDGTDLLEKIRNKVINAVKLMITGLPSVDLGTKALDIGVDAYIAKPVKPNELLELIRAKLNQKQ